MSSGNAHHTHQCPQCGCFELTVMVSQCATVKFKADGSHDVSDIGGDAEWTDTSVTSCIDCGHTDGMSSFVSGGHQDDDSTQKTVDDRNDFIFYLRTCTDNQVVGVYEKEKTAGRRDYAQLAKDEALRRGIGDQL